MKCSWKYYIILNDKDRFGSIVEEAEIPGDILPICIDLNVAASFKSP